jgi:hypothetical protein
VNKGKSVLFLGGRQHGKRLVVAELLPTLVMAAVEPVTYGDRGPDGSLRTELYDLTRFGFASAHRVVPLYVIRDTAPGDADWLVADYLENGSPEQ